MSNGLDDRLSPSEARAGSRSGLEGMSSTPTRVALEIARSGLGLALVPARAAAYLLRSDRLEREARADLEHSVRPVEAPALPPGTDWPGRPLHVFLSCAEVSGEIHAQNLVSALRAAAAECGAPPPRFTALGGPALAAGGVEIIGDPVSRSAMGFDVLSALPTYVRLFRDATRHVEVERPDLFLPVDSPALHVPLARAAKAHGVPVVHFVTPQYWGWAPWRVDSYRRAVDLALCILPFEAPWFARNGVRCEYVGHPLLDALRSVRPDRGPVDSNLLALLPGSRRHVVERNLPWMLDALSRARAKAPGLEVVIPQKESAVARLAGEIVRRKSAESWVRVEEELHPWLARSKAALSVSGTVLLDLLHHRLPAVVVYRLANARQEWLQRHFLTSPWFASVNLLAGSEVYPEFCFAGEGPIERVAAAVIRGFEDEDWRARCRWKLEIAARRLGPPGATERAARHALHVALASASRRVLGVR